MKASLLSFKPKAAATAAEARTSRRDMVNIDVLPNSDRTRSALRGMSNASVRETVAIRYLFSIGKHFSTDPVRGSNRCGASRSMALAIGLHGRGANRRRQIAW